MRLSDTFRKFFDQAETGRLETTSYPSTYEDLIVDVGFGFGVPAHIPWIAFLAPGQTVRDGIFPVFYFFKKFHYVVLAYGISEENVPIKTWGAPLKVKTIEQFFKTAKKVVPKYRKSYVFETYSTFKDSDFDRMENDLRKLIQHYTTRVPN